MTLEDYVRLLRQNWLLVLILGMVGGSASLGYSLLTTPMYEARAQVFVSTSAAADISDMSAGGNFTQQRVKSYVDLVSSTRLLSQVIGDLHLEVLPVDLAKHVEATNPTETVLINIAVTDSAPTRARDIANAISEAFPKLVAELETPPREAQSPVHVSRTETAVAPSEPVSPKTLINTILGLLVGLGTGFASAVLRDTLDRTVKGRDEAQRIAAAPVLSQVHDDPEAGEHRLITHDAFSPRAEAFRQLRTNIRFLSVDQPMKSLVVSSSVPHEGKTTTACNLAIALAQAGEQVVLVDADLRRPTVMDVFGLSSGVGLTSVLLGDIPAADAMQQWSTDLPLRVLTAGPLPPNPSELIGSTRMAALIGELTEDGSIVVLDSPPLLPVTDAALLARATDGALIVVQSGRTHGEQLTTACEALRIAGGTVLGVVLNRVSRKKSSSTYYGSYDGYHSATAITAGAAPSAAAAPVSAAPVESAEPDPLPVPSIAITTTPAPSRAPDEAAFPQSVHDLFPATSAPATSAPDASVPAASAPTSSLPDAVRQIIPAAMPMPPASPRTTVEAPASHAPHRPRTRRDARADARDATGVRHQPRTWTHHDTASHDSGPDVVIDADAGTISPLEATGATWHSEWGDLPALITTPRVNGEMNGSGRGANGRHRN